MTTSAISQITPDSVRYRDYPVERLMLDASFPEVLFLLVEGRLPDQEEVCFVEAGLIASADFGTLPPSTRASRLAANCGVETTHAIASGLSCMSKKHAPFRDAYDFLVAYDEGVSSGEIIPGLGHPILIDDPRVTALFEGCRGGRFREMLVEVSVENELPINLAGALAACVLDMGLSPDLADAVFAVGRVAGLAAHIGEQRAQPINLAQEDK